MCDMYSFGALVERVGRRARTLRWLGIPLFAGGLVLTALWVVPSVAPTVHVRWADEVEAAQRAAVERQRSLVNGTLREDGSWAYLLEDTSYTNVALIVQAPVVDDTYGIDRDRFEVPPAVVRPLFGLAPLQSFLGFGLGELLLAGSAAATRRRRTVYAAVALALLLVGMVTAPLPLHVTDDKGEWMGDFENMTEDRDRFDIASGYTSIPFPHHLTALVLKSLDAALGATARYRVPDASPQRLRAIVTHDMVADTSGFDRGSLELNAPASDVARLAAQPLVYTSGWHPAEPHATTPEATWQWTQQTGTLSFTNPNADKAFYLDYAARPDLVAGAPQTVTFRRRGCPTDC